MWKPGGTGRPAAAMRASEAPFPPTCSSVAEASSSGRTRGIDGSLLIANSPVGSRCNFMLKLFLSKSYITIQVLYKDVGDGLQFIGWDRATRLKCAVHRLGHQICKLLVGKYELVRHQWHYEEKSRKNGGEHIHLCSQAEIGTHQVMFAQKFEVGFEARHPLHVGSITIFAVCQLPYHVHIAQENRLHQG